MASELMRVSKEFRAYVKFKKKEIEKMYPNKNITLVDITKMIAKNNDMFVNININSRKKRRKNPYDDIFAITSF